jgi:hypothetical protein
LLNVVPPSVLSFHWYAKPPPVAETENVAVEPPQTAWLPGGVLIDEAAPTVRLPVMFAGSAMVPSEE